MTSRRSRLLATTAFLAFIASVGVAAAGQLDASAFQTYNAADASAITAGPFALYSVSVDSLHPTQLNEGLTEVGKKTAAFDLLTPSQLQANLLTDIEPVVIGPGGQLYLTDGHHTFTALENSIYGASNPTVYVNVIANYSNLTEAQFWAQMQASNLVFPIDNGVAQPFNTANGSPIPTSLTGLTSDVYRGLEYSILKNKSSTLFKTSANITGAPGASTPGLDKMTGYYSDFTEADAYRNANGGLGLPYLSPGDIALATQWNLNPASTTTLPGISGTVTAAQLPGFILNQNITISTPITNETMADGALDGNGTFTGITSLTNGSVTIGTPQVGFIMQLGADKGYSVTLSGANSYTGGTSILAGTLIIAGDSSLGAAAGTFTYPSNPNTLLSSIQAANGIVFNSLSEGNGTLQIGTTPGNGTGTFTTDRTIGVDGETAIINLNGYDVTLGGQIVSLGALGTGLGNATGPSDLTIDDNSANQGVLVLSGNNSNFYGNWIIGDNNAPTVRVMDDAALGNTTGVPASIGQIDLNGGTLQTGATIYAPERNLFLGGGSTFDTYGNTSTWGTLTDVQRTLLIENSSTTSAGAVTFDSFTVGATATLQLAGGTAGETVTFTNGIDRSGAATLILQPSSSTSLGTATEKVLSGTGEASLVNGIAPVWIVTNNGTSKSGGPYDFVTYDPTKGYVATTYTSALNGTTGSNVVELTGTNTLSASAKAYALNTNGQTLNLGANTLTLGDGTDPAGLILASKSAINGGTLDFGTSEGVIWLSGKSTISSAIDTSNGLTFAGSGGVTLSGPLDLQGSAINIDSGSVTLAATNMVSTGTAITLANTKSKPAAATLAITASNVISALDSVGTNSAVTISNGAILTIGDSTNQSSTLSSAITQTGVATAGALTIDTTGLVDLSGMSSKTLTLVSGSTINVEEGDLRLAASSFAQMTNITTADDTEVQFAQNGGGIFAGNVTGGGALHLIGGTLQLTGTGNNYTGGTIVEAGSTLDLTTANVSSGNADIVNAGGLIVFDQATNGTYSGVISDGSQMEGNGPALSGSLVKDDSSGANSGNLTLAAVQTYTGMTYVEAGTLTLGVKDAIASSAGVDLGRVGGQVGTTNMVTLALGADETLQSLTDEAANPTGVTLNGHTLTLGESGDVINPDASFTFNGVISDGTAAGSLVKDGAGVLTLGGLNTYSGTTDVKEGVLQAGATDAFSPNSDYTVESGSVLDANGFNQIVKSISNAGTVRTSGAAPGTVLTVTGNYSGSGSKSALVLNTVLGSDNSLTDKLHVEGNATGTTNVYINNMGGIGAATTGLGIEVVQVDGTAQADAFKLGAPVIAGAYEYGLYYVGTSGVPDPDWYLRSGYTASAQTVRPYADILGNYAFATLGTLQQRTGNRIWPNGTPPETIWCKDPAQNYRCKPNDEQNGVYANGGPVINGQGAWGRIAGQYSSYDPKTGSSYTQGLGFLQTGYEGTAYENAAGQATLGAYATVGTSRADIDLTHDPVTGAARSGKITTTGYGVGVNATWLGNDGLYADGIAQFTWYDSNLSSKINNNEGYSTALSLEVGKRFDMGGGWAVVPQAQLAYANVNFDSFTDVNGAQVKLGDGNSLQGRAGVRIENLTNWQDADGQTSRLQVYGIANLSYEFLNGTKVDVANVSLEQNEKNLWGEVGVGGTYAWNKSWSVYGEADYATALSSGSGDNYTVKGTVGVKYKW